MVLMAVRNRGRVWDETEMSGWRIGTGKAAIIALFAMTSVPVQAQTGSVQGTVFDSIAGTPLVDAAVFLWDTPYRAVTDEEGRFRIEGIPPGDYNVLFFHTRLGELGVSPGPKPVTLFGGDEVEVGLATPSMATVVTSQCLIEDRAEGSGAVAGRILDGDTFVTLGGAIVTLSWDVPGSPVPEVVNVRAGPDGWYRSCDVPSGMPVLVSAEFYGRHGARWEVTVDEGGFQDASTLLYDTQPSRITGHLTDALSGEGVDGAEAWLRGTTYRALTDGGGNFLFEDVPPGQYMLVTDHLAYGTKMDTLVVPSNQRLLVEMRLDTRPIEIAPITVTAEAQPIELARVRGGLVIDRDQIDPLRQRSRDASDILRSLHIPGVIVRHQSDGSICVGYSAGQVRMDMATCAEMLIYINDVRATNPDLALRLPPDAIERMVIYKPVEAGNLYGLGGGNGVWAIYTRGN